MWFRNLQIYRLQGDAPTAEDLAERLAAHPFRECGALETGTVGWVPPLGRHGSELTHTAAARTMLCHRRQDKILPPAVLKQMVDERAGLIEEQEARRVRRKEREGIRDELLMELMPKALLKSRDTFAFLSPGDGWLLVDAGSPKAAEEVLELLRTSVTDLRVRPLEVAESPSSIMTQWLNGDRSLPDGVSLGEECELKDISDESAVVRCRGLDLMTEEIRNHVEAGKRVTQLAVDVEERLQFVLGEDLSLRRLRFGEDVLAEVGEVEAGDAAARFDADFALMSLEIARLLPRITDAFGGEVDADGPVSADRAA